MDQTKDTSVWNIYSLTTSDLSMLDIFLVKQKQNRWEQQN